MSAVATLRQRRCLHHPAREAVARCTACSRHFCRECVTEHDDRIVCASCLAELTVKVKRRGAPFSAVGRFFLAGAAAILIFSSFYLLGRALLLLPARFHHMESWDS